MADFDPIDRAASIWAERIGDPTAMRLSTAVIRVQQLLIARLDAALKPWGITFARYEVLQLLAFSRDGALPLSKIGERLMVHPTSVTNAIDRLESQGLVVRTGDPDDRRRILAELTDTGRETVSEATEALTEIDFGITGLSAADQDRAFELLTRLRQSAGDFDAS